MTDGGSELDTWETHRLLGDEGSQLLVTALPGQHAPGALSIALPDVMGSLIDFTDEPGGFRLYITGDTLVFDRLREIPERHPEIDLALVHLGGTRVMGVTVTMDAEQGVELLQIVQPRLAIPIHYDDYEAFTSPLEDFVAAVREAGLDDRVRYLRRGEVTDLRTVAGTART